MEKVGIGSKLYTASRGGYGGMLMVGMATTVAGLGLLNPLSLGAAVLLGGKTVRDEKKRMLQRRQADAKQAVRKHIDEVTFQVGKDSRDMLRRTQRQLRDHFSALAEEVSTSIAASVAAAQSAVKTTAADRERRIRDLKAELARIDGLAERARKLVADAATAGRRHPVTSVPARRRTSRWVRPCGCCCDAPSTPTPTARRPPAGCGTTWPGSTSRCGWPSPAR